MKRLLYTVGLQGAGKSYKAKELVAASNGSLKRINRDILRELLDNGKWSKQNEKLVVKIRDTMIRLALQSGYSVVCDDTNLSPKVQADLRRIALEEEAVIEVIDLTDVPIETCIERDLKRQKSVGERVIRETFQRYLYKEPMPYPHNPKLPNCLIVDIDGTIAQMVNRGPFEWSKVYSDELRLNVIDAVWGLHNTTKAKVIFVSGRDSVCREETLRWLNNKAGFPGVAGDVFPLYMRPENDMRPDTVVKLQILDEFIRGKYNITGIFDDRPKILRMWRENGLGDKLFNVGNDIEF